MDGTISLNVADCLHEPAAEAVGKTLPKVAAFGAIKGGTGKTTALVLTARALAACGCRVLGIDADTNNTFSQSLRPDNFEELDRDNKKNIARALMSMDDAEFMSCIIPSYIPGIDLMKNHCSLTRFMPSPNILKARLAANRSELSEKYDFILIDTPATYGPLHIMIYSACDLILSPVMISSFDLESLLQLGENLKLDTSNYGKWNLFFNGVRPDSNAQDDYFDLYRSNFGNILEGIQIPLTVEARCCIDRREPVTLAEKHRKLRSAACALASFIAGREISPAGSF
jgi:cellulose biosynthesis protein BcsQ